MSINQSRYTYTVGVLDCPRPIVHLTKRKPTPAVAPVAPPTLQAAKKENDE